MERSSSPRKLQKQRKVGLTVYQKAQVRHLQTLYYENGDGSSTTPPPNVQILPKDQSDFFESDDDSIVPESTLDVAQAADVHKRKRTEDDEEAAAAQPGKVSKHRKALLQQLDLAVSIRKTLEQAAKINPNTKEAGQLLLQPDVIEAQLKLVALSEAVRDDYTLKNYDFYLKQYENQYKSRTSSQAAESLLQKGGSAMAKLSKTQTINVSNDEATDTKSKEHKSSQEPGE
eukprot:CAMPEP_0172440132 /NCGR_PEP_ID=MMETSP1065-20121228/882_1 /TAXON_ID=265537 /ORGANISM="Amphiprora paludosa, Strain CCMP125" /LENGTH=229 /DNA_ID=CAMNT_0013188915 /DNA_START=93 /DNA_END=782 /DNA_ORIENTATION=-